MTAPRAAAAPPPAAFAPRSLWAGVRRRSRDLGWLLTGRVMLIGASAATMLLLANRMSLATYGLFVSLVGVQILMSRVVLLGMDSGMIRLRALPDLRDRSDEVVHAGLFVLRRVAGLVIAGAFVAAAVMAAPAASRWFRWAAPAVALGAAGMALVDYSVSYRLSRFEYRTAALLQGGTASARLGVTTAAVLAAGRYPLLVFLAYAGTSLLSGTAQAVCLTRGRSSGRQRTPRPDRGLVQRLVRYSLWTAGADVGTVLSSQQRVFLLMLLGQRAPAGLFGLGLILSQGFGAVSSAFGDYLTPRLVQVQSLKRLPRSLARAFAGSLGLALLCVPVVMAVGKAVPWALRPGLRGMVPIFYCLVAAELLGLLASPLIATCHYLVRPHVVTFSLGVRVVAIGALGWALAPRWGAPGAAAAQLGGAALAIFVRAMLVAIELRAARRTQAGAAAGPKSPGSISLLWERTEDAG